MPLAGFHPAVQRWFAQHFSQPTEAQREGWPHIRAGRHTLISAPTGTGKTLAAYLSAIDGLLRQGSTLPDQTSVLYISPLKALSNDVQKNLQKPLRELEELDPTLPHVRVAVRTGDTPASERAAMLRRPPHILVTTPESFYILLTSAGGRAMLKTVKTVIIDEIHALARDKRGSHLALSLERLEALVGGCVSPSPSGRGWPVPRPGEGVEDQQSTNSHSVASQASSPSYSHAFTRREDPPPSPALAPEAERGRGAALPGVQRIGLSATQKPLSEVAHFLVGVGRECELVDVGHKRKIDVAIETPPSPLETVCSHEQWDEIYNRIAQLILEHRTTLVFVNTRKMAERIAARLSTVLGEEQVTCHHSSLSRERRLDAERRLKAGSLKALVATASLELGIDVGDVDLVIQVGATRSIATFLQRVGRSGHAIGRLPKGRLFPLTIDELMEASALLRAAARGELDRTPQPAAPLDILSQQIVAECVTAGEAGWSEDQFFERFKRAWPYRNMKREDFDAVIAMHLDGRHGLLHRDGVGRRIMARKRARLTAITSGGAIPDVADYRVLNDPSGIFVGTLNEDFAVEANVGDIFQLGNTSWRILKVERGTVRVADAHGQPPTIPFWLGEGPSRTAELSSAIAQLREECHDPAVLQREINLSPEAAQQIAEYIIEGKRVLGAVPTQKRLILERFFDESGGMQMVLHAPFGGRINRAWGLALRKRFCRGFGFELQAAANEEAIIISLGPHHSFPLDDVFNYLNPVSVRGVLTQAVLDQPMFESRWRWNATRSLVLERFKHGKPVPPQLLRMRAADLLVSAFPAALACPETLPGGDIPIPMGHPLVHQTIEDCLTESTDIAGLIEVLQGLRDGTIERLAIDTPEPSAFARGILSSGLYSFLDDAPLEERRTQAVLSRRTLNNTSLDTLGELDPLAVERVRQEVWPQPESIEETHDALQWMGYITDAEAADWMDWLTQLAANGRVRHANGRWFATDAATEPRKILLGRLEALGPVFPDDPRIQMGENENFTPALLMELEHQGAILRTRLNGQPAWCERRLLARIFRYTLDKLHREIEPVTSAEFLYFLTCWQHVEPSFQLVGPRGVADVLNQLAGFEIAAAAWERDILPARVRDFRKDWLDEVTLSGEFVWGRLWGGGASPVRVTPVSFIPRDQLDEWVALTPPPLTADLSAPAREVLRVLSEQGAMFPQALQKFADLLPDYLEMGVAELLAQGLITCDSFSALRQMITPPSRRRTSVRAMGRWTLFRGACPSPSGRGWRVPTPGEGVANQQPPNSKRIASQDHSPSSSHALTRREDPPPSPVLEGGGGVNAQPFLTNAATELAARQLLQRTGIVFRRTLLREKLPIPWSTLIRIYRRMELRGEIRGGRFVAGYAGEQFALPNAVELLRTLRRQGPHEPLSVASADPLNFQGILTPDKRIAPTINQQVLVG